jgi:hypothetical protein
MYFYIRVTSQTHNMTESTDGPIALHAEESSVLVQGPSFTPRPALDLTARLGDGRVTTVDVRFGRLPPGFGDDDDTCLVAPNVPDGFDSDRVYRVGGPDSLTEYGVALTRVFEDVDGPVLVELDSLTALLQHTTLDAAFRFVHVLSGRIDREQAVLVATIDPGAHDEQTVATMTQPFDVAITGEEGNRQVRRR